MEKSDENKTDVNKIIPNEQYNISKNTPNCSSSNSSSSSDEDDAKDPKAPTSSRFNSHRLSCHSFFNRISPLKRSSTQKDNYSTQSSPKFMRGAPFNLSTSVDGNDEYRKTSNSYGFSNIKKLYNKSEKRRKNIFTKSKKCNSDYFENEPEFFESTEFNKSEKNKSINEKIPSYAESIKAIFNKNLNNSNN